MWAKIHYDRIERAKEICPTHPRPQGRTVQAGGGQGSSLPTENTNHGGNRSYLVTKILIFKTSHWNEIHLMASKFFLQICNPLDNLSESTSQKQLQTYTRCSVNTGSLFSTPTHQHFITNNNQSLFFSNGIKYIPSVTVFCLLHTWQWHGYIPVDSTLLC